VNRCPITYELCGNQHYSLKGLRLLSPALTNLANLDLSAGELRTEAMVRASNMSIQGVQPKLSAILNIKKGMFDIVDKNGRYILKPQHHLFRELPMNENLTMHLAATIGIRVPLHGMVYSKDNSLTYFIKRFDRCGQKDKVAVEDFAQLAGKSRDTKYNYSMENLVKLIDDYCTFPSVEKVRLFNLVLFNYLVGNEDMHLKNYSVIVRDGKVELSPAYDLLNTTIVVKDKKRNLTRNILVNYFGKEKCGLTDKTIEKSLAIIQAAIPGWYTLIGISFLSETMKDKYRKLLQDRTRILFG